MKIKTLLTLAFLPVLTIQNTLAQGLLTPTGPPERTMKTLDQVEPRIPLTSLSDGVSKSIITGAYIISAPGSYYLTGNVMVKAEPGAGTGGGTGGGNGTPPDAAIKITSSNVTLDLMGYTIGNTFTTTGGAAILLEGENLSNITIKNGNISSQITYDPNNATAPLSGTGFNHGIVYNANFPPAPKNAVVEDISINGVKETAIRLGGASTIKNCHINICKNGILFAKIVSHSSAQACTELGISASIVDNCSASSLGLGRFNTAISGTNVTNCTAEIDTGDAIDAVNATNCTGQSTSGKGINATRNVLNSTGTSSTGVGIAASGNVSNSRGASGQLSGISAGENVTDSKGRTLGALPGIACSGNVTNSRGESQYGDGIRSSGNVSDSTGESFGPSSGNDGDGIYCAKNVSNSHGESSGGSGIHAEGNVLNSTGTTSGDDGIHAKGNVSNSTGTTTSSSIDADGIFSSANVSNSTGTSSGDDGIDAQDGIVSNSKGVTTGDDGIRAGIVSNSWGESTNTSPGNYSIHAGRAVACITIGTHSITHEYLMD